MGLLTAEGGIEGPSRAAARSSVFTAVVLALGLSHLFNDAIQSLILAIYPSWRPSSRSTSPGSA